MTTGITSGVAPAAERSFLSFGCHAAQSDPQHPFDVLEAGLRQAIEAHLPTALTQQPADGEA